uniref:Uncharacterized protein n=1 Tax=Cacopsylla melanoneura TaxID=428564 RepID=A0A8D8T4K9_9HEMI
MPEQTTPLKNDDDEIPFCFVCDHPACGSYFNLANCVTEYSQSKMSDKLAHLVGEEEYLVVVEETDIICRSCWNILNTMDRLECQLFKLGNTVLNFFEKKYFLSPGELFQTAPPLVVVFKKESEVSESESSEKEKEDDPKKDSTKEDKENDKLIQCAECNYATEFKAMMVFHMRQHTKMNHATSSELPAGGVMERRGVKRGSKSGGISKRGRASESVDDVETEIQGVHTGEGFEFLNSSEDDPLSSEMLNKVEALIDGTSGTQNIEETEGGSDFSITEALPAAEDQHPADDDSSLLQLQPLLDLENSAPEGMTFCMLDTNTGKVVQRLRKKPDGSYVAIELLPSDTRAVMQQLEDGTLALVSLPDVLGEEGLSLL